MLCSRIVSQLNVAEAEYTFRNGKHVVPLRLQTDYNPDGWLGALVGNKLYFDFSQPSKYDDSMRRLIKQLERYKKAAFGKTKDNGKWNIDQ